jgi:hypothetical protein
MVVRLAGPLVSRRLAGDFDRHDFARIDQSG